MCSPAIDDTPKRFAAQSVCDGNDPDIEVEPHRNGSPSKMRRFAATGDDERAAAADAIYRPIPGFNQEAALLSA